MELTIEGQRILREARDLMERSLKQEFAEDEDIPCKADVYGATGASVDLIARHPELTKRTFRFGNRVRTYATLIGGAIAIKDDGVAVFEGESALREQAEGVSPHSSERRLSSNLKHAPLC